MSTTALVPAQGTQFDTFDVAGTSVQLLWTDTTPTVVAKAICEQFGLAWQVQHRKLTDPNSGLNCHHMVMVAADGKDREMLTLSVADAVRWVMGISPSKVAAEARDRLIAFQKAFLPALVARVEAHWRRVAEAAVWSLSRLRTEVIARKPLWTKIRDWMAEGRSFDEIWRASRRPQRVVVEAIADMQRLGLIAAPPAGMPAVQMQLFAEG